MPRRARRAERGSKIKEQASERSLICGHFHLHRDKRQCTVPEAAGGTVRALRRTRCCCTTGPHVPCRSTHQAQQLNSLRRPPPGILTQTQ